jgi:NAD(P)-dependent dehydrogenase (short-subunit alcohol dehydrogenase family)
MHIKDHVLLVTGASSGIGLSTAIAADDRDAKVALFTRSRNALARSARCRKIPNLSENRLDGLEAPGNYCDGVNPTSFTNCLKLGSSRRLRSIVSRARPAMIDS